MNVESGRTGDEALLYFSSICLKGMGNKKIVAKKCAYFFIYD
jgi:hypothetical protein